MNGRTKLIVAIVVALFIGAGIGAGITYKAVHKPPVVKPEVTVYKEYKGMYFPYTLKVTYYKNNATGSYGFPSNWLVNYFMLKH